MAFALRNVLLYSSLLRLLNAHPHLGDGASGAPSLLDNVTVFDPPPNYSIPRTLYARTLLLDRKSSKSQTPSGYDHHAGRQHNAAAPVLLATWENYLPGNDTNPYFPIYQSLDLGASWTERTKVYDQVNGWGLRYQPFLYELEEDIGTFEKGTVLLAGNSIPDDLSETQIDLYASGDKGYTWEFVSHIASGGRAIPNNGETPVWEPFMMVYEGQMIMYYSDQRDPAHGQKLVHQTSTDLLTWGPVVDDVAYGNYTFRPGMTTVSKLPAGNPSGNWIMTYEFYGAPEAAFAVYYRIATSPLIFNESPGLPLIAKDGTVPVSSPYNVWTPAGGANGTMVVSCGTLSEVFLNTQLGAPDAWERLATPEGVSYSRSLRVMPDRQQILIAGGGPLGGEDNSVTVSTIEL